MILQGQEQGKTKRNAYGVGGLGAAMYDGEGNYIGDDGSTFTPIQSVGPGDTVPTGFNASWLPSNAQAAQISASQLPGSSSNWFSDLLSPLTKAAASISSTRYAVPQLNAGQSIITGPGGTQMYQQPAGVPAIGGALSSAGSSSMILILGVGAVLLFTMSKGR